MMVANIEGKEQAQLWNFYARREKNFGATVLAKPWPQSFLTHAGLSV